MTVPSPVFLVRPGGLAGCSPTDQAYIAQEMIAASHLGTFDLYPRNAMLLAQFVVDINEGRPPSQAVRAEVGRLAERYDESRRLTSKRIK